MDRESFAKAAANVGIELTEPQLDRFELFEQRLYETNEVMNLTRVPREECWSRHFLDSLLFQDLVPRNARLLDIGTGPGFPAWPLACARPDLQVVAIDSSGKMIGFLSRNPLPNLKPIQIRAEEWDVREAFDVVTGRAVAPLFIQLELSAPFAAVGGLVIPMRTPSDAELVPSAVEPLGLKLESLVDRELPVCGARRFFPLYRKVSRCDRRFPRTWAEIRGKPLT